MRYALPTAAAGRRERKQHFNMREENGRHRQYLPI